MSNLIRLIGRRLVALPVMVLGVTLLVFVVMSFSSADRRVSRWASRPRQTPSSSTESPTISTIPFSSGSGSTSWV